MKKASAKLKATTPVTLGWRVRRVWEDSAGKFHEKIVSRQFSSTSAADVFRVSAAKYDEPKPGEKNIKFEVVSEQGFDSIPVAE